MMYLIRLAALAITLVPAFYQMDYKKPDDYTYEDSSRDSDVDSYEEENGDNGLHGALNGCWEDVDGNLLYFDTDEQSYKYHTWYGRCGTGDMNEYNGSVWLWCGDTSYDLIPAGSGFTLKEDEVSKAGELSGAHFEPSSREFPDISVEMLDGIWQNALGETLVIDTSRREFLYYTERIADWGSLFDDEDGCGWYLFWDRDSFPCISEDGNSLLFSFRESDSGDSDGDFLKGVFYRDGDVETYADPENSCFYQAEGHVWYDDGVRIFELPGSYTLGDDGLAYDKNGQVFANAQDWKKYDPSADWGKDWAIMWYDSES